MSGDLNSGGSKSYNIWRGVNSASRGGEQVYVCGGFEILTIAGKPKCLEQNGQGGGSSENPQEPDHLGQSRPF